MDAKLHRNDPCFCGSGKKYKKCCLSKEIPSLPCVAPAGPNLERCNASSTGAFECAICDKRYAYCAIHEEVTTRMLSGHVVRLHPEKVSKELLDKLISNPAAMAALRQQRVQSPELWARLFEFIAEREGGMS